MIWERIDQYASFHIGDDVLWQAPDGVENGTISEMAQSPDGVVFWLSCAPFWVRPQAVLHNRLAHRENRPGYSETTGSI